MKKLSLTDLQRQSVEEFKSAEKMPIVVILDNIRSLHNVGTFFRTGDAFSITHLYLCGFTGTPPHKDIHKTALGATESVAWSHHVSTVDLIQQLKKEGYTILGIEQTSASIMLQDYPVQADKKYALIFGNEISGVQQESLEHSDNAIEIPQFGTKHSFNVSVTSGIVLWEFVRKMKYGK
ncbi:MAG: RNA methyltransferase [Cytophagaceae bacterium]